MRSPRKLGLALAGAIVFAVAPASAQSLVDYGIGVTVGAGGGDFTDSDVRDMTDPAVAWNATIALGLATRIGVEASYTGSAQAIDALGMDDSTILVSSAGELAMRVNLMTGMLQPYVVAGIGYKRYDLTNSDFNTSDVADSDDLAQVPLGLGLAYRAGHLLFDARATLRTVFEQDLLPVEEGASSEPALDSWEATARMGWEF